MVVKRTKKNAEIHVPRGVMTLRGEDRRVFIEALLNPPRPNTALKAAAARYKRQGL